jgi:Uma2 family endonuclease
MVIGVATRKFTVDEFHRMVEAGILQEDDRLELLDGEIIEMPPIGSLHSSVVDSLNRLLVLALQDLPATVRVQNPVQLSADTELYPDLALVKAREDFYRGSIPRAADVLLIVEVSDTTLDYDRNTKAARYARAGLPELWIVDVVSSTLEVHREPDNNGTYSHVSYCRRGESVSPLAFPGTELAVTDCLG